MELFACFLEILEFLIFEISLRFDDHETSTERRKTNKFASFSSTFSEFIHN